MKMARAARFRSPGLQALYDHYVGDDPAEAAAYEVAKSNADVAQAVYDLRTGAGLTQQQLAAKVGTTASVICRLEDADYEGHSLSILRRIAAAVGRRVELRFPAESGRSPPREATAARTKKASGGKAPKKPKQKPPKAKKQAERPGRGDAVKGSKKRLMRGRR
jgi:transcriptional regulator with XRE-family HTH domain